MSNTVLWNDPDTQQLIGNNNQVEATYLIDPFTKKAFSGNTIMDAIRNGQGFIAWQSMTTATIAALGIFNASNSGKGILIYRIYAVSGTAGSTIKLFKQTTDYAFGAVTQGAVNRSLGNTTPSIATVSGAATGAVTAGTQMFSGLIAANAPYELLTQPILLPSGSAQALGIFLTQGGATTGLINVEWIEF